MKGSRIGMVGLVTVMSLGFVAALQAEGPGSMLDNLQRAYAAKSKAQVRYEAFAGKADEEGYKSVAAMFRAAADSEGVRASGFAGHIRKMAAEPKAAIDKPTIKSTKENLESSLTDLAEEEKGMYPGFIKMAESEKHDMAVMSFKGSVAAQTEEMKLFKQALGSLEEWKAAGKTFGVCQVCGYPVAGDPPPKCPVCAATRDKFKLFK